MRSRKHCDKLPRELRRRRLDVAARSAAKSQSARACQKLRALARHGYPWTKAEDDIVVAAHPDYKRLRRMLPHRTRDAIKTRVYNLGIARKVPLWTCAEVKILRAANNRVTTKDDLCALLPHRSKRAVEEKFKRLGYQLRKRLKSLGNPLLDHVRERALDRNFTTKELDAELGTARYWSFPFRHVSWWRVANLLPLLEMSLVLEIDDGDKTRRIRLC